MRSVRLILLIVAVVVPVPFALADTPESADTVANASQVPSYEQALSHLFEGFADYEALLKLHYSAKYMAKTVNISWETTSSASALIFGAYLEYSRRILDWIPAWQKIAAGIRDPNLRSRTENAIKDLDAAIRQIGGGVGDREFWSQSRRAGVRVVSDYDDQIKKLCDQAREVAFRSDLERALRLLREDPRLSSEAATEVTLREGQLQQLTTAIAQAEARLEGATTDAEIAMQARRSRSAALERDIAGEVSRLQLLQAEVARTVEPAEQLAELFRYGTVVVDPIGFPKIDSLQSQFQGFSRRIVAAMESQIREALRSYPDLTPNIEVHWQVIDPQPVAAGGLLSKKRTIGFSGTLEVQVRVWAPLQEQRLPIQTFRFRDLSDKPSTKLEMDLAQYGRRIISPVLQRVHKNARLINTDDFLTQIEKCRSLLVGRPAT
jgi:hypothetical protein